MSQYVESFDNLYHGTDAVAAAKICDEGFKPSKAEGNWCGSGVYFYDIKAKAHWSARRTCEVIRKTTGKKATPVVICAEIANLDRKYILDLRSRKGIDELREVARPLLDGVDYVVEEVGDEFDQKVFLRSQLIEFCAAKLNKLLVIGQFQQRVRPEDAVLSEFARQLDLVIGLETIYCVKNVSIITSISLGGAGDD